MTRLIRQPFPSSVVPRRHAQGLPELFSYSSGTDLAEGDGLGSCSTEPVLDAITALLSSDAVEITEANEHIVSGSTLSVGGLGGLSGLSGSVHATGDGFELIQAQLGVDAVGDAGGGGGCGGGHGSEWSVDECWGRSPMTTPSPQSIDHVMTCVRDDCDLGHTEQSCCGVDLVITASLVISDVLSLLEG